MTPTRAGRPRMAVACLAFAALAPILPACSEEQAPAPADASACRPSESSDTAVLCIRSVNIVAPSPWLELYSYDADQRPLTLTFTAIGSENARLYIRWAQGRAAPCTYLVPFRVDADVGVTWSGADFRQADGDTFDLAVEPSDDGSPPLLFLRRARLSGQLAADRSAIGSWSADRERWSSGGVIQGLITVAETRSICMPTFSGVIDPCGATLCGNISRDDGEIGNPADDCTSDPATWFRPPDADLDGEPAWILRATYAAEACSVVPSTSPGE